MKTLLQLAKNLSAIGENQIASRIVKLSSGQSLHQEWNDWYANYEGLGQIISSLPEKSQVYLDYMQEQEVSPPNLDLFYQLYAGADSKVYLANALYTYAKDESVTLRELASRIFTDENEIQMYVAGKRRAFPYDLGRLRKVMFPEIDVGSTHSIYFYDFKLTEVGKEAVEGLKFWWDLKAGRIPEITKKAFQKKEQNFFYHGSPISGIKVLEPRHDSRLGIFGLFVGDEPFGPSAFSLLPVRSDTVVNVETKNGEFVSGEIISPRKINNKGSLYIIQPDPNSIIERKPGRFYVTEPTPILREVKVSKQDLINMGWDIKEGITDSQAGFLFQNIKNASIIDQWSEWSSIVKTSSITWKNYLPKPTSGNFTREDMLHKWLPEKSQIYLDWMQEQNLPPPNLNLMFAPIWKKRLVKALYDYGTDNYVLLEEAAYNEFPNSSQQRNYWLMDLKTDLPYKTSSLSKLLEPEIDVKWSALMQDNEFSITKEGMSAVEGMKFWDNLLAGNIPNITKESSNKLISNNIPEMTLNKTAVVIGGNPKYIKNNPQASVFYKELIKYLESLGFATMFDSGAPYTSPPRADLWVGHSMGADRLEGAVPEYATYAVALGVPDPEAFQQENYFAINHPDDQPELGKTPLREHYILTEDMKVLLASISEELNKTNEI